MQVLQGEGIRTVIADPIDNRYKLAAAFYNLSQLMRKLFGFGTPKQLAALGRLLFLQVTWFWCYLSPWGVEIRFKGISLCKALRHKRAPRHELVLT